MTPEHNPQHAQMLVELDAILDTRLGTIAKFGREAYVQALAGGYYFRNSDHFEGIDPVKFRQLYRERDAVTLSLSMISHVITLIKDFVARVNVVSVSAPVKKVPRVDINMYPYNPPKRVQAMMEKAIRALVKDRFDMSFVRYSPSDLHYDLVKFTYDHLVMYHLGPWLEANAEDWKRRDRGLPDVTVFFPALHMGEDKSEIPDDISVMADDVNRELSPILNPMQVPARFFCAVLDPAMLTQGSPEAEAPGEPKGQDEVTPRG